MTCAPRGERNRSALANATHPQRLWFGWRAFALLKARRPIPGGYHDSNFRPPPGYLPGRWARAVVVAPQWLSVGLGSTVRRYLPILTVRRREAGRFGAWR